jgi:hypothetical protein
MAKVLGRANQSEGTGCKLTLTGQKMSVCFFHNWMSRGRVAFAQASSALPLAWLAPAQARQPEGVRSDTNFVAEVGKHFASHLELSCFTLCPLLSGFSQIMVSARDLSGGGFSEAGVGESCLESTLRFGEFCQYDLFRGNSAKLTDEADLRQNPDDPFRRIDLPGFYSIPVVVLKLVVIVMIPFTEGKDCEEPRVASTAF